MKKNILKANVDFLNGPILKGLIAFAIPVLISNLFQQLYNTVDTMIVGHYLGDSSLAAIGSCTSIYDLLVGFALLPFGEPSSFNSSPCCFSVQKPVPDNSSEPSGAKKPYISIL